MKNYIYIVLNLNIVLIDSAGAYPVNVTASANGREKKQPGCEPPSAKETMANKQDLEYTTWCSF
jgi:hypothetical protein